MPYIKKERRAAIENQDVALFPGELNYIISREIDAFIMDHGLTYTTLNSVIGVLECCKMEIYRRIITPLEEKKMAENGDVFDCIKIE